MGGRYCVRVYPDGEAKHTIREEAGLESWLAYNRTARPGNALFVDGVLAGPSDDGMLGEEQVAHVSGTIRRELAAGAHDLARIDGIGPQIDFLGGQSRRYEGYRAEANREPFRLPERAAAPRP